MSGNEIETFQKISDFIDSFDSTSLGSIIILAILVCVVLVSVFKSIYSTSVEELFMNSKEKNKNMFFQLLVMTDNINFYKLYVAEYSPDFYGDIIRSCQPGGIYSISKKGKWYEKVFRNDR